MPRYRLRVNGSMRAVDSLDPDKPLLYVLRGLGLTAAKFGCGLGQCGACTVLVDGKAVRSCQITSRMRRANRSPRWKASARRQIRIRIQTAFIKEQVPQCGYCTSGIIMSAAALLSEKPKPTEADIRTALDGNLCRCGSHVRVLRAVMAASGQGG